MPQVVHIGLGDRGTFKVRYPYHKALTEEMKALVPHGHRVWDSGEHAWFVAADYFAEVHALFAKYFGDDVQIVASKTAEAMMLTKLIDNLKDPQMADYMTLGVRPEVTAIVLHQAYFAYEMYFTGLALFDKDWDKDPERVKVAAQIPDHIQRLLEPEKAAVDAVAVALSRRSFVSAGEEVDRPGQELVVYRLAYFKVCHHRKIAPLVPLMVKEMFLKKSMMPEQVYRLLKDSFDLQGHF